MTEKSTENLAKFIAQRRQCLVQMRDLGRKQSELISTGEMGALLRLLAAKQQLITALQAIEQGLDPYHDEAPESRQWNSSEAREKCSQQANDCRLLLAEVMQLEKQNEEQISIRRDEVASQLQTAHAASLARGAYQSQQTIASKNVPPPLGYFSAGGSTVEGTMHGDMLDIQSEN